MDWDIGLVKQELRGPSALVMAPFDDDLSLHEEAIRRNIDSLVKSLCRSN